MDSKKIGVVLLAFALAACGGPTMMVDNPDDGMTVTYIVNTADVPEPDAMDRLPGFDLDMANGTAATDACNDALDYTSPVTGSGGVDNQLGANVIGLLASMLMGGVRGAIEEQIAAGTFLLMMEVNDIDNFNNDGSVSVSLFLGMGTPMVGGDGRITAGQTFTRMGAALATISDAEISGGRLDIRATVLPLSLNIMGSDVTLMLRQARIGGMITMGGMSGGEIGAQVSVADIVALADMFAPGSFDEATIRSVAMPDLDPNADGSICNGISVGMTFEATTAANLAP